MERQTLPFVIVGHVDHGKSTLIGRLLYETKSLPPDKVAEIEAMSAELGREVEFAFVLDSLEEERSQNITIETTQVFFKTATRDYVIIDAPGHVEFIKNMITGASQAEAACVIIDAEEGLQEQTRRHSYLLSLLDISQIAVVINKMDKVDFSAQRFAQLQGEMEQFLGSFGRRPAAVIPICARDGDNIATRSARLPWYAGPTVLEQLDRFRPLSRVAEGEVCLPVQDVYKVGDKRILVGRVERGTIRVGQELLFVPSGKPATVRTVEIFLAEGRQSAGEGESIGITIDKPLFVERGQVAFPASRPVAASSQVQAKVFWMSPYPLQAGEPLSMRCATQGVPVQELRIDRRINSSNLAVLEERGTTLQENEVGEVTIVTKTPIVVEPMHQGGELGRFVLTRGDSVVAGGIVISGQA